MSDHDPFTGAEAQVFAPTAVQQTIWSWVRNQPASAGAFHETFALRLRGPVDEEALVWALETLPGFHEGLRGHFNAEGDLFVIDPDLRLPVSRQDLSVLSPEHRHQAITAAEDRGVRTPYNLENGPLFRAEVLKTGSDEWVVVFGSHLIVCDGWSMDVVLADLGRIYAAGIGKAFLPAPPAHTLGDYLTYQAAPRFQAAVEKSREGWKRRFPELPPRVALGPDRPRTWENLRTTARVGPEILAAVREFAKNQGLSLFPVLLSAQALAVHRATGSRNFVIVVPIAGHLDADMEDCVGPLVHSVPIGFQISDGVSFADFCRQTNETVLDARENSSVDWAEVGAGTGTIGFTHIQKYHPSKLNFGGLTVDYRPLARSSTTLDWHLTVFESSEGIELFADGAADLVSREWLGARLTDFQGFLAPRGVEAPISPSADRSRYALSPSQERNFFAATRGPGIPLAVSLRGQIRVGLLAQVLGAFIARHPVLRSRFEDTDQGYRAFIQPAGPVSLPVRDLGSRGIIPGSREWEEHLEGTASQPFDLARGPLFRFELFRFSDDQHVLLAVFSQMAFDGSSLGIFIRELTGAYGAAEQGRTWEPVPLAVEYSDYSQWRRRVVDGLSLTETQWWKSRLGEAIPGGLVPLDHPRPPVPSYRGLTVPYEIPGSLVPGLRALAKASGVTVQMLFLSALFLLLRKLADRREALVAVPVTGRSHPDLEPLVGAFTNMLLLRSPQDPDPEFTQFLTQVRDDCLEAYEHLEMPLDEIGFRIQKDGIAGKVPLFQVEFDYEIVDRWPQTMGSLAIAPVVVHGGSAANELTLWMKDAGDRIFGTFEYSAELFEPGTVSSWTDAYLNLLEDIVRRPDTRIRELDLLGGSAPEGEKALVKALDIPVVGLDPVALQDRPRVRLVGEDLRPVPLGAWGRLVLDGQVFGPQVRLRTGGTLEVRTQRQAEPQIREHLRTTVFDPVDFQVCEIFSKVLGITEVGLHDNFFDLGGHSSLAVQLLNRVKKYSGQALSLAVLFEAPTPYRLSKVLRRGMGLPDPETGLLDNNAVPESNTVVPIQTQGTLPPFFVAAGVGGNPMNLRYVSKYLGDDQPYYGLQHRGTDGRHAPHRSVSKLVANYLEDIRKVQPHGPYYLGGFSAGGIAAFEIARELLRLGEKVGTVVMFDAESPLARSVDVVSLTDKIKSRGWQFVRHGLANRSKRLAATAQREFGSFMARFRPYEFRNQAVESAWIQAVKGYQPQPCSVDVVVFRAEDRSGNTTDPTNGWKDLVTGDLRIIAVDGDHVTHVGPPHVYRLADILKVELAAARAKQGT